MNDTDDRTYTKGDCYALCEFLEVLLKDHKRVVFNIADYLGYEHDSMLNTLARLASDFNNTIFDEQNECDYTEQMADIMQIKHIKGGE